MAPLRNPAVGSDEAGDPLACSPRCLHVLFVLLFFSRSSPPPTINMLQSEQDLQVSRNCHFVLLSPPPPLPPPAPAFFNRRATPTVCFCSASVPLAAVPGLGRKLTVGRRRDGSRCSDRPHRRVPPLSEQRSGVVAPLRAGGTGISA